MGAVTAARPLSIADMQELQHVAERMGRSALFEYMGRVSNVRLAHGLVRRGYLSRERFSEQFRGERRFYWWVFSLTEKGRAALAADASPSEAGSHAKNSATSPAVAECVRREIGRE